MKYSLSESPDTMQLQLQTNEAMIQEMMSIISQVTAFILMIAGISLIV